MSIAIGVFNIVFSAEIAIDLTQLFGGFFLNESSLDFLVERYSPTFRQALQDAGVKPCLGTRLKLLSMLVGTLLKMVRTRYFRSFSTQRYCLTQVFRLSTVLRLLVARECCPRSAS
jgi:hypothetical protein